MEADNSKNDSANQYAVIPFSMFLSMIGQGNMVAIPYLTIMPIFSLIGFVLNLFSFFILLDSEFNILLYKYLRVYTINSAITNLVSIFLFVSSTPSVFPWSFTYEAQVYFPFIYLPIGYTGYMFGALLDMIITLDRIANFKNAIKRLFVFSPYKVSFVVLVFCGLFQIPSIMSWSRLSMTVSDDKNSSRIYVIWYTYLSQFSFTQVGKILTNIIRAVRDVLFAVIQVVLNIISVYYLRAYLNKRRNLIGQSGPTMTVHAQPTLLAEQSIQLQKVSKPHKTGHAVNTQFSKRAPAVTFKKDHSVSPANRKLSTMVMFLCMFSIVQHCFLIAAVVYPYFSSISSTVNFVYFWAAFSITFKHFMNFFLFYLFNSNFKKICLRYLKIRRES
jgi:hypothetical protein